MVTLRLGSELSHSRLAVFLAVLSHSREIAGMQTCQVHSYSNRLPGQSFVILCLNAIFFFWNNSLQTGYYLSVNIWRPHDS